VVVPLPPGLAFSEVVPPPHPTNAAATSTTNAWQYRHVAIYLQLSPEETNLSRSHKYMPKSTIVPVLSSPYCRKRERFSGMALHPQISGIVGLLTFPSLSEQSTERTHLKILKSPPSQFPKSAVATPIAIPTRITLIRKGLRFRRCT
jgi:hypothetical protein